MLLVEQSNQFLLSHRTVVSYGVLIAIEVVNAIHQLLRIHRLELLLTKDIGHGVIGTVGYISQQMREVVALVTLSIYTLLQNIIHQVSVSLFVNLCMSQQLLHQRHSLGHVVIQSRQEDETATTGTDYLIGASQTVEFALHLFGGHVVST